MMNDTGYQPIENCGVIGDLHTVALVGMDASIDFMSFFHFDSPTIFAALLDHKKGGRFQIAPCLGEARRKQTGSFLYPKGMTAFLFFCGRTSR